MSKIIRVDFSGKKKPVYEKDPPPRKERHFGRDNLLVRLNKTEDGYTVSIFKMGLLSATFRTSLDYDLALRVYKEIVHHIRIKDLTYEELSSLLNEKLS